MGWKSKEAYREYLSRPEVIARRAEVKAVYDARPDVIERRRAHERARRLKPGYKEMKKESDAKSHQKHKEARNAASKERASRPEAKARNKERLAERMADPEELAKIRAQQKARREKLKDWHKAYVAQWSKDNKDYINQHLKNRRETDLNYAMSIRVRGRVNVALTAKGVQKKCKSFDTLGCNTERLIEHIESLFTDGMSWERRKEIDLDHIIPLSLFDLSDEEELFAVCHYTNLQPLWASDNRSKHNKFEVDGKPVTDKETLLRLLREQRERIENGNTDPT